MSIDFDRETFDAVTAGDGGIARELTDLFCTDSSRLLGELSEAVARRDDEVVRRTAHTLKSSSGSLGAMKASELAAKIEHGGMDAAIELLRVLETAVESATHAMSATVAELPQ